MEPYPVFTGEWDVSFTVPEGTVFGILGGTGSGKSTIAQFLTRLYELDGQKGKITIGGKQIKEISLEELLAEKGYYHDLYYMQFEEESTMKVFSEQ